MIFFKFAFSNGSAHNDLAKLAFVIFADVVHIQIFQIFHGNLRASTSLTGFRFNVFTFPSTNLLIATTNYAQYVRDNYSTKNRTLVSFIFEFVIKWRKKLNFWKIPSLNLKPTQSYRK